MSWILVRRSCSSLFSIGEEEVRLFDLMRVDNGEGETVATIRDEPVAQRIVALLNRHGLEDVDLSGLPDDVTDRLT